MTVYKKIRVVIKKGEKLANATEKRMNQYGLSAKKGIFGGLSQVVSHTPSELANHKKNIQGIVIPKVGYEVTSVKLNFNLGKVEKDKK